MYVATGSGLTVVRLSDGGVKELARVQCGPVTDVAVADRLALATHEDVLVTDVCDGTLESTGFGPANAVTLADGELLAGGPGGRVARYGDGDWSTLGTVGEVRAVDRNLVGAWDGVYRIVNDGLSGAGLDDVRDVSATGRPLVAIAEPSTTWGPGGPAHSTVRSPLWSGRACSRTSHSREGVPDSCRCPGPATAPVRLCPNAGQPRKDY